MKKFLVFMFAIFLCFKAEWAFADKLDNTSYQVCFTPYEDCTQVIVDIINAAKKSILVQAYSFTSRPIGKALVNAHKKGVEVRMIFDKSQAIPNQYSSARFFGNQNMTVWIDFKVANAHNKVMIIDNYAVITGSFNFTRAAQEKNTENVLIIWNSSLAKKYAENWEKRLKESVPYKGTTNLISTRRL